MSAFVVDDAHIDYLVTAALENNLSWIGGHVPIVRICDPGANPTDVGRMLLRENVASVSHRYNGDVDASLPDEYVFHRIVEVAIDPVQVFKAIACYIYQSCEHAGWERSGAAEFCRALALTMQRRLPGYEQAAWEITRPLLAVKS